MHRDPRRKTKIKKKEARENAGSKRKVQKEK
jgi:hypothetical protein